MSWTNMAMMIVSHHHRRRWPRQPIRKSRPGSSECWISDDSRYHRPWLFPLGPRGGWDYPEAWGRHSMEISKSNCWIWSHTYAVQHCIFMCLEATLTAWCREVSIHLKHTADLVTSTVEQLYKNSSFLLPFGIPKKGKDWGSHKTSQSDHFAWASCGNCPASICPEKPWRFIWWKYHQ